MTTDPSSSSLDVLIEKDDDEEKDMMIMLTAGEVLQCVKSNGRYFRKHRPDVADRDRLQNHARMAEWYLGGLRGAQISDESATAAAVAAQSAGIPLNPRILMQILDDMPSHAIHIYPVLREYVESTGLDETNGILSSLCEAARSSHRQIDLDPSSI